MANPNVNEKGYIYGKWQSGPATWTIMLQGSPHFIYLLIGEEKQIKILLFVLLYSEDFHYLKYRSPKSPAR